MTITRRNALLAPAATRRNALLGRARAAPLTRRGALVGRIGVASRIPTQFYNRKGRQFFLTLRGTYVVRENGKSIYGRKAAGPSASRAPKAIRPKKI
jgi:hypothetical protein